MKYWQLMVVCRRAGQEALPATKASERKEWGRFGEWHLRYEALVRGQERDKLDFELPDEYVRTVLKDVRLSYYLTAGGQGLCHPRCAPTDRELSASEAYILCGGDAIETALEKGVACREQRDEATRYLWTIDERGVNIALESTPFPTERGHIVYTNISSRASIAGEAWFTADGKVTINNYSGQFGRNASVEQWAAANAYWERLGYEVEALPFIGTQDRSPS